MLVICLQTGYYSDSRDNGMNAKKRGRLMLTETTEEAVECLIEFIRKPTATLVSTWLTLDESTSVTVRFYDIGPSYWLDP